MTKLRVWDLPLRLFHWLLVVAVSTAVITGVNGGSWMSIHLNAGLVVIGLLAFRLAWFFCGSTYARLSTILKSLFSIPSYLKGQWHGLGHNPLGVLSVFGLLGFTAWQAVSGLFSQEFGAIKGPLVFLIDRNLSDDITSLHRLGLWVIVGLVSLHVLAIIGYFLFKKNNLVTPMITGKAEQTNPAQTAAKGGGAIAFIISLVFAGAVVYLVSGNWYTPPPPPPAPAFNF